MPGDISVVVVSSPLETPRKRGSLLGRRETLKYEIGSLVCEQRTLMSSSRREPRGKGVAMTSDTGAEGGCALSPDVPPPPDTAQTTDARGPADKPTPETHACPERGPPRGAAWTPARGGTVRPPAWLGGEHLRVRRPTTLAQDASPLRWLQLCK